MRTLLTLILLAAMAFIVNAQPGWSVIIPGDSVKLILSNYNGSIQWQESTDSLLWSDMTGFTDSIAVFLATSSPTNKRFYRAEITNVSICANSPWYSSVLCYKVITSTTQIVIGDWFHGGIVFYTDGTGYGLIAPKQDQSTGVQWGCYGNSILGATSLTDGNANTTAIYNNCGDHPIAASICYDLEINGYNDWFLPAKDQLNYLYQQRALIGNFSNNLYWSSSESDTDYAWEQIFGNGFQDLFYKYSSYYVRCIRSFSLADNTTTEISYVTVIDQPEAVSFDSQVQSVVFCEGMGVNITFPLQGTPPINYHWKKNGVDITGATDYFLTLDVLTDTDEGIYTCEATNMCNSVLSENYEITVMSSSVSAGPDIVFCNDTAAQIIATATTNHPEIGPFTYSWTPSNGLSATDIFNPVAQPLNNVTYIIVVTDGFGCLNYDTINVTSVTPASFLTQPSSYDICLGSDASFSVVAEGTPPLSYIWKKNGSVITGIDSDNFSIYNTNSSDEAVYTCELTNYCRTSVSDDAVLNIIQLSLYAGIDARLCTGDSTVLSANAASNHPAESGTYSYSWSPSEGLSSDIIYNPDASPAITTDYTILITDQIGCTETDIVNVLVQNVFQNEEICIVTVDTTVWKNKIMWEGTPDVGTAKYCIYREVVTNVYNWIGEVLCGSQTYFIDVASNPESHSDRYKITVIDTCSNESDRSAYHNTMNLVVSVFGNTMGLVWTPYQTEDGSYTPDQYYIYKGPTPQTMTLLTTVTGSQNTYNDVNVFDLQYYMIGAHRDCNTDPAYSNKRDNGLVGINAANLTGTILIAPNPMTNTTIITIPNFVETPNEPLQVFDVTGKLVRIITPDFLQNTSTTQKGLQVEIQRGDLKPGIYFVELKADRTYRGKLVVE